MFNKLLLPVNSCKSCLVMSLSITQNFLPFKWLEILTLLQLQWTEESSKGVKLCIKYFIDKRLLIFTEIYMNHKLLYSQFFSCDISLRAFNTKTCKQIFVLLFSSYREIYNGLR